MPTDRSVSDVLQDIVRNLQDIIRSEVRLAKSEVREEVVKAKAAGLYLGVATLSAVFAVLFLLFAVVYALAHVMRDWAAALTVGVVLGIVAVVTMRVGVGRLQRVDPTPDKTLGSLKENVEWAKHQTK
jgi:uncharacterized membrane protein YqjE